MGGERPASKTAVVDEEREGAGITIEVLEQHFHQPLVTVAEELGVSLTMIKRLCRKLGMPRWPYRQIDSINKAMEDLHDQLQSARTEADRARYAKQLDAALKKKRLITRGAAAGVDPNVRNALYLADTADVSEEDIFGNPELMPKLSAALKTITKRKRVKGKPLVDLIATVQRDGSLPACVQVGSNGMSSSASSVATNNTVPPPTSTQGGIGNINRGRGPSVTSAGGRRLHRPPALDDALATSNEEYAANIGQAYGIVHHPGSSASATSISTSVSPVLTSIDTSSSAEDYFRHDWGHNNSGSSVGYGLQQYGGSSTRSAPPSVRGFTGGTLGSGGIGMDSPASSCTTLVAGASPGEGSISGGFSPSTKDELSPATSGAHATSAHLQRIGAEAAVMGRSVSSMRSTNATGARMQMPSSAPSIGGGHHWGHRPLNAGGGHLRTQHKRVSVTSSVASTDVDSLDTSHLLEFDDDDDDEGLDGSQLYGTGEMGNVDCYGGSSTAGGGAGGGGQGVSPEELRELEDALLMDNFVMGEELLTDMSTLAEAKGHQSFPDFRNVRASLPPLPRTDHTTGGQRGTPRSLSSGGNGSQHVPAVIGVSSSNAGSASPVNGATSNLAGNNTGHPRHGQRSMGRARSEVPPRPYTPGKATRGVSLPWPSQGLGGGGVSPRVGSSPRPPTPGTPVGTRMAPSPNGRRRGGEEAFPENFALPSANDLPPNGVGGPSPKSRRVGVRTFSERFPGSPQAGMVSPRMGFPHVSPRNSGAAGNFNVGACSPLDGGSDRTYFPGPASNTAVTAGFATGSPAHQSRSHRRSSSNNWGSGSGPAPRHGGMGDGGIDSSSAENSSINAGFEMTGNSPNWPGRLGESIKTNNSEASLCGRQSWGASSSGDTQSPQLNLSPRTAVSVAGGGTRPAFKSSTSHGHGVVCRRHSSPLPSFQTASGSIDSTGENAAAIGHLKTEFTKSEYVHDGGDMNDGHGNEVVGNGGGTTSVGMGGVLAAPAWAPPSPMLEASSLWSVIEGQHERHESMRAMSEASAAAVAAVAAAAVPSSGALTTSSSTLDDLSTRVMTTSMTMDL